VRRTDESQRHALLADGERGATDIRADRRIEGERLDAQPRRIDDFEDEFAGIDYLARHRVGGGNHARDGRNQHLAGRKSPTHSSDALGQAACLALGRLDVLARHGVGQLLQARDALVRQALGCAQLGQLRGLVRSLDRRGRGHDIGQHFPFAHRLSGIWQTSWPRFDAAGIQWLYLAPCVGVHHHLAIQLERARQLGLFGEQGAHAELPLRGLGQKHAAIR